ncbi:hypothetical protein DRQ53_07775 [bacterium]|nr:MAG: hypothetical protein DRQ32_02340 [bacterium]RKZ15902.1 MAG: hypothetical protein DRQ53_07775 [bacterium]
MGVFRFRCVELLLTITVAVAMAPSLVHAGQLVDAPVLWTADDMRPLEETPAERDPIVHWTFYEAGFSRPTEYLLNFPRLVRRIGAPFGVEKDPESVNMNRLGEVPNSSWFTNRIGLFPLPPSALELGPNEMRGPSHDAPWSVVGAKTQGVTPGFTIEDANGNRFLIKFGTLTAPVAPTAAGVVSQRLLWAAGYWVPQDEVVHFRPEELALAEGVQMRDASGHKRLMTSEDLESILDRVEHMPDGRIRALSSRFLSGRPIGPFDYQGRREDDPNDTISHQYRRELRALNVFAEWLIHFDTKQQNTLDMVIEGPAGPYVRHYLIDFASTLGTGAEGFAGNWGWEVSLDPAAIVGRALGVGIAVPDYRQVQLNAEMPAAGWYESEQFSANGFRPMMQNPAFQRMSVRDGYWAAKILSAFTDEHLRVAAAQGQYRDAATREYMARTLAERRDKICEYWFDRVAPMDFFIVRGKEVVWQDLGLRNSVYEGASAYRVRLRAVDAEREGNDADWTTVNRTAVRTDISSISDEPVGTHPFVELTVQVDRGDSFGPSVRCYVSRVSGRVVEVQRDRR